MCRLQKKHLRSPSNFIQDYSDYIRQLHGELSGVANLIWNEEELAQLVLSALRSNDFNTVHPEGVTQLSVDENALRTWCLHKLFPSSVAIPMDDVDVVGLLLLSI